MYKSLIITALLSVCVCVSGQIRTAQSQAAIARACGAGWEVQQVSYSFDHQTAIVSARRVGQADYNLCRLKRTQQAWGELQVLPSPLNSSDDELWPSLSSDEQTLYFVRRQAASGKDKKSRDRYTIMVSQREGTGWSEPMAIIISNGQEVSPLIHADGQTLYFASCRPVAGQKEPQFGIYYTRRLGQYDWYTPEAVVLPETRGVNLYGAELFDDNGRLTLRYTQQVCEKHDTTYSFGQTVVPEQMQPRSVMTLSGTLTDAGSGRLISGHIEVFDALTGNRLSAHEAHGPYRLALPAEGNYRIDITAEGYSHRYLHYDCHALARDTTVQQDIPLTPALTLRAYVFDSETDLPLNGYRIEAQGCPTRVGKGYSELTLPIGQAHTLRLSKRGYADTTLVIDTRKPVLLSHSELDIDMRPGKAPLHVQVVDEKTEDKIADARISIRNTSRKENESDQAEVQVRQGDAYLIHVDATGYVYADTAITIPYDTKAITCVIRLSSLQADMVVQLSNIQFEYDSYDLLEESYEELDKVVQMLQDNPGLSIELSAHTDDQGSDRYNDALSQRRGESAKRYITRHGIAPERIHATGYGKRRPLVPNDSEAHRAINRRVEFKVLGL